MIHFVKLQLKTRFVYPVFDLFFNVGNVKAIVETLEEKSKKTDIPLAQPNFKGRREGNFYKRDILN